MAESVTANHVLSCDEVRRVDRYAIEKLGIAGIVLMENAGRQVADAVEQFLLGVPGIGRQAALASSHGRISPLADKAVAVVAGTGNNGGDGFVAARHLALRGAKVATFLIYPEDRLSGDALTNWRILRNLGHDVRVLDSSSLTTLATNLQPFDVVIDAIAGTGLSGALRDEMAEAVRQVNHAAKPIVAIDIPTGLDCDTGVPAGLAIKAVMTVTMVAVKKGFAEIGAERYTGKVIVADIGTPPEVQA